MWRWAGDWSLTCEHYKRECTFDNTVARSYGWWWCYRMPIRAGKRTIIVQAGHHWTTQVQTADVKVLYNIHKQKLLSPPIWNQYRLYNHSPASTFSHVQIAYSLEWNWLCGPIAFVQHFILTWLPFNVTWDPYRTINISTVFRARVEDLPLISRGWGALRASIKNIQNVSNVWVSRIP